MDIKKTIPCILIRPKYSPINTSEKELEMAKVAEKLHQWAEELFGYTDKVHIIDIQNENANRKIVEEILRENPKIPVLFYGHGLENGYSLLGHYGENILDRDNNSLLKERSVLAIACYSLIHFAKDCINKGVSGYIGYKDRFFVPPDDIPLVDMEIIQKSYRIPNNTGALQSLNNWNIKEIYDCMCNAYESEFNELLNLALNDESYKPFALGLLANLIGLNYEPNEQSGNE